MKICGIYKITSPTNKIYIGQSVDILKRIEHYRNCRCEAQRLLYRSIKKHGWDKHKLEILCQCDKTDLNQLEVYYIELFQSFNSDYGLNLETGGKVHEKSDETKRRLSESHKGLPNPNKGKKLPPLSEEAKRNMSIALKGKPKSEETKRRMSIAFRGRKMSAEHKEKLRKINSERKRTDEWKKHLSEMLTGRKRKPFTEEHLRRMSESQKGHKQSDEQRRKFSERMKGNNYGKYNIGRRHTEESIQKMILAQTGHIVSEETKKKISETKKRAKIERLKNIAA